jgi:polysaccharide export outer membrane protein
VFSAKSLKLREFLRHLPLGLILLTGAAPLYTAVAADGPPTAPASAPPAGAANATPAAAANPPPPAVSPNYLIGPGDSLHIYVFQNEDLSVTVPVRPDGKISTPLVEDMVAVGKTPSQLARDLEKSLAVYVKSPKVNVVVMTAISVFSQVKVIGQVKMPQALPYRDGMTVLDAVLAVGGLGQFAAGNRAHLVRTENGKQTEIKVKLDSLVNSGDMKQNLALHPGDVLVVPESRF